MTILKAISILIGGEIIIHILFSLISRVIGKQNRDKISLSSVLKGIVERTYVVTVLFIEVASALTLLGALKIATRIKDDESKVSNDFFLIGNLISVLFGVVYYVFLKDTI